MHRPDTCHLTHVYVKRELTYLSKRVDEVARYFIALEELVGTGMLAPVLERAFRDFESHVNAAEKLEDPDDARGVIDAAIRLGVNPKRYAPLRERLEWLEKGRHREKLRKELSCVSGISHAMKLQGLIDAAVQAGVEASEVEPARQRLREVRQIALDEEMLAAAARGDVCGAEACIRRGANCDACRAEDCASLWHLAVVREEDGLAQLCERVNAASGHLDANGWTPLMAAAAGNHVGSARWLLAFGADPNALSEASEHLVECADAQAMAELRLLVGQEDRLLQQPLQVPGVTLDVGDKLVVGEALQLPVFRRAAGRSALHVAVLRAEAPGAEAPLLQALVEHSADVDLCDAAQRTPLWYAAQAGRVTAALLLLRAGADVAVTHPAPLVAAAQGRKQAWVVGDDTAAATYDELCRLLMTNGAGRNSQQVRAAAESFGGDFAMACRPVTSFEDALALIGGPVTLAECRSACTVDLKLYESRLLMQRGQHMSSAAEAAAFSATVLPHLEEVAFTLARTNGGRVVLSRVPNEVRMRRLARHLGLAGPGKVVESAVDWSRVTGAAQSRLVFQSAPAVYRALECLEAQCADQIRAVSDGLQTPDGKGSAAVTCLDHAVCSTAPPEIAVLLEVSGVVCLLRLTLARVVEAEEAWLSRGEWLRRELASAIIAGSPQEVQEALEFSEDHLDDLRRKAFLDMPLAVDHGDSVPAVCAAVSRGQPEILSLLLDAMASPEAQDRGGRSALALALEIESLPCLVRLVGRGADPAALAPLAAGAGRSGGDSFLEAARDLLERARVQRGVDALALAKLVEHFDGSGASLETARRLLGAGADANAWTRAPGSLPLLARAASHRSKDLVRLLLQHGALVQTVAGKASALIAARGTRCEPLLLQQAAQELQVAMHEGDLSAVHRLLAAGMDPESAVAAPGGARTLLTFAAELPPEQGLPLLRELLELAAQTGLRDAAGQMPLHAGLAAMAPAAVVSLLLRYGAPVHELDCSGRTPAMVAAATGNYEALAELLEAGARGDERDTRDIDAPLYAFKATHGDCVQLLGQHGFPLDKQAALAELFVACRSGDADRVALLLDIASRQHPSIACCSEDGVAAGQAPTLLMEAARAGSSRSAQALLAHGAWLHPQASGTSAWALAGPEVRAVLRRRVPVELLQVAREGHAVAATNLRMDERLGLALGPEDFEVLDDEGFGALDHAVKGGWCELELWFTHSGARFYGLKASPPVLLEPVKAGDVETVRRRVAAGADVMVMDAAGRTPVDWCLLAGALAGMLLTCVETALSQVEAEPPSDVLSPNSSCYGGRLAARRSSAPAMPPTIHLSQTCDSGRRGSVSLLSLTTEATSVAIREQNLRTPGGGTSVAPSVRNARGAMGQRRRSHYTVMDPGGPYSQAEAVLVEAGGRLGALVRSAAFCLQEPLEDRFYETVYRRIAAGADCRITNQLGVGVAHMALDACSIGVATALVQAGAPPDGRDHRGRTVIWRAVEGQHRELVEACLCGGANLDLGLGSSNDGSLAHLALETDQPELAQRLICGQPGCPPDRMDTHGRTVAQRALQLRQVDVLRACLACGADATVTEHTTGQGLVQIALESGQSELVSELLQAGVPTDQIDCECRTPMQTAAGLGEDSVVALLLAAGARPGPGGGREALAALRSGHTELAEKLVRAAGLARPAELRRVRSRRGRGQSQAEPPEESSLLELAGQAGATGVADAFLAAGLEGAGLGPLAASQAADLLARWLAEDSQAPEAEERVAVLERLPGTIAEHGPRAAATSLLQRGAPAEVVDLLSHAQVAVARAPSKGLRRGPAPSPAAPAGAVPYSIERLRAEADGVRVCILGPTSFMSPNSRDLVAAVARELSRLDVRISFFTLAMPGVQQTFAEHCNSSRLWNLLPAGQTSGYGSGKDVCAGTAMDECKEVFAQLGDVYLTAEGGPALAGEAKAALARGALLLPLRRTGGASSGLCAFPQEALARPAFASEEHWQLVGQEDAPVAESAAAVAAIFNAFASSRGASAPAPSPSSPG